MSDSKATTAGHHANRTHSAAAAPLANALNTALPFVPKDLTHIVTDYAFAWGIPLPSLTPFSFDHAEPTRAGLHRSADWDAPASVSVVVASSFPRKEKGPAVPKTVPRVSLK